MSMRTLRIELKKDHPAAAHFAKNAAASRAVRNRANFLIRNAMTGLHKSPEERTSNETEALHDIFTGIQKANSKRIANGKAPFAYPTAGKWFLGYPVLDAILKETGDPAYGSAVSHVAQQAIKKTVGAWKSYFAARSSYKRGPGKFEAPPRLPGYVKESYVTAHFTNQVCRLSEDDGRLYLHFARYGKVAIGPKGLLPGKYIKTDVRPYYGGWLLLVTYDDGVELPSVPARPKRALGLDIGLENFLAGASNTGDTPFLIKGGWIKAQNQWFNKRRAQLLSSLAGGKDSRHSRKTSPSLERLSRQRGRMLREFFYKCAHSVARWCVAHGIEVIVIGHNRNPKQGIRLRRKTNQNFVSIPYGRFIQVLRTVAAKYGIPVIEQEESYTSKASSLDNDQIPRYGETGCVAIFSGKRVKRGLYRSADGTLLNADINAAANILRKAYPDIFADKDLSYLAGPVAVVTGEELLGIHPKEKKKKKPGKSPAAALRHRQRKQDRFSYLLLFSA